MRQKLQLILLLPILAGCEESTFHEHLEIAQLVVDAEINSSVRRFRPGEVKVRGDIVVANSSQQTINYSNERLWLSVAQVGSRRTYVDNVASHVVDHGFVEILPGDEMQLSVYWVFPDTIDSPLTENSVKLEFAIP